MGSMSKYNSTCNEVVCPKSYKNSRRSCVFLLLPSRLYQRRLIRVWGRVMRVTFAFEDRVEFNDAQRRWVVKFAIGLVSAAVVILGCVCVAG
jgi:hypothetical protein